MRYEVKGSHLIQAREWIDARLGAGTFRRLMLEQGATGGEVLLPGTWHDVEALVRVLAVVARLVGRPLDEITTEITIMNARADLTTIYRIFLRIARPQRLLAHTPRLWGTYVRFGDASILVNEPGRYVGQGVGIPPPLLDWACGAWCGFLPAAIELAGGTHVKARIAERSVDPDGLARLRCEIRYSTG